MVFIADPRLVTLAALKPQYSARGGGRGITNHQSGTRGKDIVVKVL